MAITTSIASDLSNLQDTSTGVSAGKVTDLTITNGAITNAAITAETVTQATITNAAITNAAITNGSVGASGTMTMGNAANFALGTGSGSMLGTGSTQKLGFWGATPVVQPATTTQTSGEAGLVNGAGATANAVTNTTNFNGGSGTKTYTINAIVQALKAAGILAYS